MRRVQPTDWNWSLASSQLRYREITWTMPSTIDISAGDKAELHVVVVVKGVEASIVDRATEVDC